LFAFIHHLIQLQRRHSVHFLVNEW
jgi:hypothetical protein